MRRCSSCKTHKPLAAYNRKWKDRDVLQPICIECESDRHLIRKYGMGADVWKRKKLLEQDGKCGGCSTDDPGHVYGWTLDHCHETGRWRDVLCHRCNIARGFVDAGWDVKVFAEFIRNERQPAGYE